MGVQLICFQNVIWGSFNNTFDSFLKSFSKSKPKQFSIPPYSIHLILLNNHQYTGNYKAFIHLLSLFFKKIYNPI